MDAIAVEAPTVRRVLGKLSQPQLRRIKSYGRKKRFSHSWYWHGPAGNTGMDFRDVQLNALGIQDACACALAVAFNVEPSTSSGNFWGAKVDRKLMEAMSHLSAASGSDVGTVNYILELSKLSHEELTSIVDDCLSGGKLPDQPSMSEPVQETFLDREPPPLKTRDQAPTLKRVLSALSKKQLGLLLEYSLGNVFHHGWYWFGPEGAVGVVSKEKRFAKKGLGDPIAIAFELTPSRARNSWRGCELNDKFVRALAFWAKHTGGESGMADYVLELNSLNSEELNRLIRETAGGAPRKVNVQT